MSESVPSVSKNQELTNTGDFRSDINEMISMSDSDCDYDKELNEILARYEEAASKETIYLLHTVFPLSTNYIQIQCGLSPARCFCPAVIIQHNFKPIRISFSTFEWSTFIELLRHLQIKFFATSIEGHRDEYEPVTHPCGDYITISQLIYEDMKMLSIFRHGITVDLFEQDVNELLKMDKSLLSQRITMLDSLNFCEYYYSVLDMISNWLKSNKISSNVEEIILGFCEISNGTLLSNALCEYLYFYKNSVLNDLSNK